jgi:hypothetical protein
MDDAAIYKEVAEAALKQLDGYEVTACGVKIQYTRIYKLFRVWNLNNELVCEDTDLSTAVTLAHRKLQAERDAKDAPKLREALEKIANNEMADRVAAEWFQRVAREALKE